MDRYSSSSTAFPPFLVDYESFTGHLSDVLDPYENVVKGKRFAEFARGVLPNTDIGQRYEIPVMRKLSNDGGVDLVADSNDGTEVLYIQSKYGIANKDHIDGIISNFHNFELGLTELQDSPIQLDLFSGGAKQVMHYMILTASKLLETQKLRNYEESHLSSVDFYRTLQVEDRLHIVDGPRFFRAAQAAYRKRHSLPTKLVLKFAAGPLAVGNVYVGVLPGNVLKDLYRDYQESLFFENIRSYLGPTTGKVQVSDRLTVNQAIEMTIVENPEKFLSRNNGITFRASRVTPQPDNSTLVLDQASIVNGCQTSMSIINADSGVASCLVLTKVVETDDAWDIAESANNQTPVERVNLKIARFMRTQALREAADKYGFQFRVPEEESASLSSVFDAISTAEIAEEEVRALFVGFFSKTPENALDMNYERLDYQTLDSYELDPNRDRVLLSLFRINVAIQEATREIEETAEFDTIKTLFRRFWQTRTKKTPRYRAVLGILATCRLAADNLYQSPPGISYQGLKSVLEEVNRILDTDPSGFINAYLRAFRTLYVDVRSRNDDVDDAKLPQLLSDAIDRAKFNHLYALYEAVGL